jgi:hypothetical protein
LIGTSLITQLVVRRVQAHSERGIAVGAQPIHERHQAGRGHGDATLAQAEAEVVLQDADRDQRLRIVGERLAHAHEHDVADHALVLEITAESFRSEPDLRDDLGGGQIAAETLLRGRAERAVHRATDLR